MKYIVIIPAAGQGKRMKAGKNKLLLELNNKPILMHTVNVFIKDPACTEVIIAINKAEEKEISSLFSSKKITFVYGGKERQDSVYQGLLAASHGEYVLVHDGARPFITTELIGRILQGVRETGAAICGVPVKDTVKRVEEGIVQETMDREYLWSVQTPQGFSYDILRNAHEQAKVEGFLGTDEASLVERANQPVTMVLGDYGNFKITTPEDLLIAEKFSTRKKG